MKILQARSSLNGKPKAIELETLEKKIKDGEGAFFYLDRENEHKVLNEFIEYFEEKGKNVLMREVRYALGDLDFMYEVHIY